MVLWKSKKDGTHFRHNKVKRVSGDIDDEKIISILDSDDILEAVDNFNDSHNQDVNSDDLEPIEDLSGKQRRQVEEYVGSPVVLTYNDFIHKPSLIFANHEQWLVYKSEEDVNNDIKKTLESQLKDFPEMFDQSWLDNFRSITMSEENRIIKSQEESHRLTDHAGKHELLGLAKSFGINLNNHKFDNESQLRSIVMGGIQKELKHQLQDPIEYYVNLEGRYTESQLAKMPWVETKIRYDDAINDAIETNGRVHFLSTLDGREVKVGDLFMYRLK